jgi:hypothetical protein
MIEEIKEEEEEMNQEKKKDKVKGRNMLGFDKEEDD